MQHLILGDLQMKAIKYLAVLFVLVLSTSISIASEKYAVLITGDYADTSRANYSGSWATNNNIDRDRRPMEEFWNDTYLLWEILVTEKGYSNENVFVLFAGGIDYPIDSDVDLPENWADRYTPLDNYEHILGEGGQITDYPADSANVNDVFTGLANGSNGFPRITEDDFLFVWTFDHGYPDPNSDHVLLGLIDDRIFDYEFAALTDQINANKKVFWMQQCNSGGFIDDLEGEDTFIITASHADTGAEPADQFASWTDDFEIYCDEAVENEIISLHTYTHGEFNFHLFSSTIGKSPAYYTQYPENNGEPYTNADLNNDSIISFLESKEWLFYQDSICDCHWGPFCAVPDSSDLGNIGSTTSLEYPTLIPSTIIGNYNVRGIIGIPKTVNVCSGATLTFESNSDVSILSENQLIIEDDATLIIGAGTIIHASENSSIICNGDLVVSGTEDNPVTIMGNAWEGIYANGTVEFDFVNISGSDKVGIGSADNATGHIRNCIISNNVVGIRLNYVDNEFVIEDNIISDNTSFGINLRHSSPDIIDNDIHGNNYIGILMMSGSNSVVKGNHIYNNGMMNASSLASGINMISSSPELITSVNGVPFNYPVNNEIDNHTTGIFVAFMGSPNLGVYSENNFTINGGLNHFHDNGISLNRSYAGPYWPDEPSHRNYRTLFAEVNYWNSDLSEEAEPDNISGSRISTTPTAPSVIGIVEEDEIRLLRDGLILEQKGEFPQARSKYTEYLQTDPNEEGIITALGGINRAYEKENDIESLISELEYWREVGNNEAISTIAQTQLIWAYKSINADEQAIETVEELIAEYEGTDLEPYYILELALLLEESDGALLFRTNPNEPTANQILEQGIAKVYSEYSESDVAELFRLLYGGDSQITTESNSQLPNQFALLNAYPNPFNPVTTIQYEIPEQSQITLTVFDLNGRVIAELEDRNIDGGKYQSLWDGTDNIGKQVATGIYFYQLTAISSETGKVFTQSNKMLLLK